MENEHFEKLPPFKLALNEINAVCQLQELTSIKLTRSAASNTVKPVYTGHAT